MVTLDTQAWQHQYINVNQTNQVRLHYVTQGQGDLVILLHGFPEFWYSWRFQLPALARHFKVVVPDLRGYNDSEKTKQGYDLKTVSQDILSLITSLGYERAHIVGHDCGGVIAWYLAQNFPQALGKLVVLNAPPPDGLFRELWGQLDHLWRRWPLLACQVPGLAEYWLGSNLRGFIQDWFQRYSIRKAAFSNDTLQIYQSALEKAGAISGALQSYRHLLLPQAWWPQFRNQVQQINIPTLVLWGADDPVVSRSLTESLEHLLTGPWRLRLLNDCGHWAMQEVPDLVNRELINFLRGDALPLTNS
ncbi:alpha/beta fold hydrolase [Synechococcus sp. PCC 6312]|uniref:alpha/beta fold hydrolase n=1 Tax=Synechococcus sp. (strain ATCC 27167 / PCC 6312) TaxID=195253 RepID=UPI00029EFEAF|nr:alpha/beta hydrolase [Synechococcus sp. PCC 6312]AFY59670.1 putative hydrolase or acyltransferase of alpha/beta superfamily [Synechococcus sp. PCC 6312]